VAHPLPTGGDSAYPPDELNLPEAGGRWEPASPAPAPHLPAAGRTRDSVHRCVYFDWSSYFCLSVFLRKQS